MKLTHVFPHQTLASHKVKGFQKTHECGSWLRGCAAHWATDVDPTLSQSVGGKLRPATLSRHLDDTSKSANTA